MMKERNNYHSDRKERSYDRRIRNERSSRNNAEYDGQGPEDTDMDEENASSYIEGRNPVIEAMRAGTTIDKLFVLEGLRDGPISSILRLAKKNDVVVNFVSKTRLDQMSVTGSHQGVIAQAAAFHYSEIDDIFARAEEKKEDPFIVLCDNIEDPHNLGSIIRTADLVGAHGVIIPKRHAVGITPVVLKASAGAVEYLPVVKVTNISKTIEALKDRGLWFAAADMDGEVMYDANMTGPIGLVVGNEGSGVSRLVKEKCDYTVSIPMQGDIDSLNASVAKAVLSYEIRRQRMFLSRK